MKQKNRPMLQFLKERCLFTFIFRGRNRPRSFDVFPPSVFSSMLLLRSVLHCSGSFRGFLFKCQTRVARLPDVLCRHSCCINCCIWGCVCACTFQLLPFVRWTVWAVLSQTVASGRKLALFRRTKDGCTSQVDNVQRKETSCVFWCSMLYLLFSLNDTRLKACKGLLWIAAF